MKGYEIMKRINKIVSAMVIGGMMTAMLAGCTKTTDPAAGDVVDTSMDEAVTSVTQLADVTTYIEVGDYKNMEISISGSVDIDPALPTQYANYYFSNAASSVDSANYIFDRAVEDGDMIHLDYTGYKDGEAFQGGSTDGAGTTLLIGSNSYIDGFESGLVGVMPGETVDLNLTFPEDYGNADLAGAEVVFNVTVNAIIPEEAIIEAWATNTATEATSFADIEKYYENLLIENAQSEYDEEIDSAIAQKLIEITTVKVEFPGALINEYRNSAQGTLEYYASNYGTDTETIASYFLGTTADDYINNVSYDQLKLAATCRYIAEQEGLMVDDTELNNRAVVYLVDLGYSNPGEVLADADMEEFRLQFMQDDVLAYMRSIVKINSAN